MKVSSVTKIQSDGLNDQHYHVNHNQDEFIVKSKMVILEHRIRKIQRFDDKY